MCNSPVSANSSASDGGKNSIYISGSTSFNQSGNSSPSSAGGEEDTCSSSEPIYSEATVSGSSESEMDSSDDECLPSTLNKTHEQFFGRKKVLQLMAVQHKANRALLRTKALDAATVFDSWKRQERQLFKVSCKGFIIFAFLEVDNNNSVCFRF